MILYSPHFCNSQISALSIPQRGRQHLFSVFCYLVLHTKSHDDGRRGVQGISQCFLQMCCTR